MAATEPGWRNRIVGHGEEAPDQLLANPRNWRLHPKRQQEALAGVLAEVGWVQDVIVNRTTGHVVDGHARVGIAISRREATVPVVYVELTPDEEAKVLATFDPLGAMAGADKAQLDALLAEVRTDDAALRGALRDLADDNGLAWGGDPPPGEAPEAEVDRAEELREKWQTAVGQLWVIGKHRLLCGDAFAEGDHDRLLAGVDIAFALTDPPYGVGLQYGPQTDDTPALVERVIAETLPLLRRFPVVAITSGHRWLWRYPAPSWLLAWVHPAGGGVGPWGFTCLHPILVYGADPYLARGLGSRADTIVLAADRAGVDGHPAPKPLAVWEWLLERCSPAPGEGVVDPFVGSGTTLVAAERLGRCGYGMEIEPKYVAVTLERLSKMGLEPRLSEAEKMAAPRKYTQAQMLTALEQSKGMTTVAARLLGCAVDTVYAYLERYPALAEAKRQQREGMTDVAELALYKAIQSGEAWAVCFYLKTQGKGRGYVERVEQQHSGSITQEITGAVEIHAVDYRTSIRALRPPDPEDEAAG